VTPQAEFLCQKVMLAYDEAGNGVCLLLRGGKNCLFERLMTPTQTLKFVEVERNEFSRTVCYVCQKHRESAVPVSGSPAAAH